MSAIKSLFAAMFAAIRILPRFFRANWRWILLLHLIAFAADQYFIFLEDVITAQRSEDVAGLAFAASLSTAFELCWYSFYLALTARALAILKFENAPEPIHGTSLGAHVNSLLIETLRVLARVIFWLPFFVLPAVYHYLRLAFVPFIVISDPDYEAGKVDALKRSRAVTRGHIGFTLAVMLLAVSLEPLVNTVISHGDSAVWRNPLGAGLGLLATILLDAWALAFFYGAYLRLRKNSLVS